MKRTAATRSESWLSRVAGGESRADAARLREKAVEEPLLEWRCLVREVGLRASDRLSHKEPTAVAFQDPDVVIIVYNSNVKHELNGGEYKERVLQYQAAVKALQTYGHAEMTHLRDATVPALDSVCETLGDEVVYRRARHAITEDERTVAAVEHIRAHEHAEAGNLMFECHESLRNYYEGGTPELDYLVETARGCEGVFGARMTGGGFGGCIVALVQQQHAQKLMQTLDAGYPVDKFGLELPKPASFKTRIGDGAHVV